MTDIIVAHYNEDLKWLEDIDYHKIIYSKGENKIGISLPNVGRESHTYCNHIINNWNYLADYNIFCQGNPFEHCKNFIDMIKVPHETMLTDEYFLSDERGCPQHCGLSIEVFADLILPDMKFPVQFGAGAQFMVKKETIYNLGWEFWARLYEYHQYNDAFPWIIERLWKKILLI